MSVSLCSGGVPRVRLRGRNFADIVSSARRGLGALRYATTVERTWRLGQPRQNIRVRVAGEGA